MNNKRVRTKAMAMAVAAAMAVELCPVTAFAVTGDQVAADGTYTSTAQVNRDPAADVDDDWADYGVSVELTVKDGKFENITVTPDAAYSSGNDSYFNKAYNKSKGIKTLLEGQPATEATINGWKIGADGVSGATRTATAVKQAALAAIQSAAEKQDPTPVEVKTDGLQASITAAEGKNQADYTEASWTNMTEKLTAAKAALEAKESQEAVDAAQKALDEAVAALEIKPSEPETPDVTTGTYVLMNIPYDQFYAADVNNSVKVDAFTSATKNKVRTGSLAGGSYHVDASGDEITGVTFPVKVPAGTDLSKYTQITDDSKVSITVTNRGQESTTDYTGKDALFESASHSYYTLSEKPSYYKELTVNEDGTFSFGATQGTVTTITEGVTAELKDGETSVATTISGLTLPEEFDAEYTVEGATASVKGEKLILKDVKKGAYTLTITDKSGKYAPISFGFEVYAETMPAAYNENSEKPGLTKAAGATDAEFADYIKNITSVSVNGKPYAVSGRNAVKLFNDDGTLITDAAPFAEGDSFEIVVTATGYKDLSFVYKKAAKEDPAKEINTASLEKAIQSAEALKEADYTADSWKVLQVALKNAKSALEAKKDQTSVDNAAASLNKAIEALVKADGTTPTPTPTTTPTATPAASKNNITTSGTGNKTTTSSGSTSTSKTAKTGDPTNILEMLGLAVASLGTGGFALKRRKRNKK